MALLNVFISILGISFVIFFHELGHFLLFRYFDVHVEEFSIGIGSSLFNFKDKLGANWVFRWLILGGYVAPLEESKEGLKGWNELTPWQNIVVAFFGPFFNFILAFFLLVGIAVGVGVPVMKYHVSHVIVGSVADRHDFRKGDRIVEVITQTDDCVRKGFESVKIVDGSVIVVDRVNEVINKKIYLNKGESFDGLGFCYSYEKRNLFKSLSFCINDLITKIVMSFVALCSIFSSIVLSALGYTSNSSYRQLNGTIGIINIMQYSLSNAWSDFLYIIAKISISIGAFNLIPLPVCDGGKIFISCIEWVLNKKIDEKFSNFLMFTSFAFLIFLVALSTILDLVNIFA